MPGELRGGLTNCSGTCTNTAFDPANCTACGMSCGPYSNALASCASGCVMTCNAGFADCNANRTDGCERNLNSDVTNCGRCGNACAAAANATTTCSSGACGFVCNAGFGNCDSNPTNGCETDLQSSNSNCGACGVVCGSGLVCRSGTCVTTLTVIEAFDASWPASGWTAVGGGGGTATSGCAHDGASGLTDPDWFYRASPTVGTAGQVLSAWARPGDGRFYFGFGANATGGFSFVMAPNTGDIRFQRNSGYGFEELNSSPQSFTAGRWYRMEITFGTGGAVTGRLYDQDGTTLLNTVTQTFADFRTGGVSIRSFGGFCIDTITLR